MKILAICEGVTYNYLGKGMGRWEGVIWQIMGQWTLSHCDNELSS